MSLEKAIQKLTRAISEKRAPGRFAPGLERDDPRPGFDPFGYSLGECPSDQGFFSPTRLSPGTCCYATQPDGQCFRQCRDHNGVLENARPFGAGRCPREGLFAPTY